MAFWKRKATAEEPSGSSPLSLDGTSMTGEDDATPQPAQAQEWTKGSELKTRAVKAGIWSGIFVWPVAVAIVLGAGGSPTKADVTESVRPGITEQSAGAVASGFVGAWLSSTKKDPSALKQFVDPSTLTLNDQPWEYKNLSVVSATDPGPGGLIAVQVSAEVKESAVDGEGKPTTQWPQRFFNVTIRVDGSSVGVLGLPSPVAGPNRPASDPSLVYGSRVSTSDAAGQAVVAFLAAYLTGNGDVSRYVKPGFQVTPVLPAPYVSVKAGDISVDRDVPASPKDGSVLRIKTDVLLTAAGGQQLPAQYTLTLTARAGRWETSSIDPVPAVLTSNKKTNSTSTKTPTSTPTEGK